MHWSWCLKYRLVLLFQGPFAAVGQKSKMKNVWRSGANRNTEGVSVFLESNEDLTIKQIMSKGIKGTDGKTTAGNQNSKLPFRRRKIRGKAETMSSLCHIYHIYIYICTSSIIQVIIQSVLVQRLLSS